MKRPPLPGRTFRSICLLQAEKALQADCPFRYRRGLKNETQHVAGRNVVSNAM